jgi:hypothetical protein
VDRGTRDRGRLPLDKARGREAGRLTPGPLRLSVQEAAALVFYVTLGVSPFSFAEDMVRSLGRWAWTGVLPGLLLGLLGLGAVIVLHRRRPQASVLAVASEVLGRAGGWVYGALLGLLFAVGAGANLHVFVDLLHTTLAPRLSPWVPAGVMTVLAAYAAFFGPEVIARVCLVLLVVLVPALTAMFTLPWLNAVPGRLWPLWTVPWGQLLHHPRAASALGVCRGLLPLLVLAPAVEGRGFGRRTVVAQLLASVLLMLAFAIPVAVFGPTLAGRLRFPLVDAAGTLSWQWLPVQRLGHVAVLFWEGISFVVVAIYLWLGAAVGGRLALRGRWRPLLPVVAVATLLLAGPLIGPTVQRDMLSIWNGGVVLLGMLLPAVLAVAVLVRTRPARGGGSLPRARSSSASPSAAAPNSRISTIAP